MNKVELIASMADAAGIKKIEAEKALNAFIDTVISELALGAEIRLVGFGTFSVSYRKPTEGRNMRTKEVIKIPGRNIPKFKAGKRLKEVVAKGTKK
ncbi:MAG: HU family DNA-binding protein [Holosporales bacterium]|jgi:DNA-binding protein HU-beta|nr:HU family DNA-binding protein [Holosporales bacterium]